MRAAALVLFAEIFFLFFFVFTLLAAAVWLLKALECRTNTLVTTYARAGLIRAGLFAPRTGGKRSACSPPVPPFHVAPPVASVPVALLFCLTFGVPPFSTALPSCDRPPCVCAFPPPF